MAHTEETSSPVEGEMEGRLRILVIMWDLCCVPWYMMIICCHGPQGGSNSPLLGEKEKRSGSDGAEQEGEREKVESHELVGESGGGGQEQVKKEPVKAEGTEGTKEVERCEEEVIEYRSHRRKHGVTSGSSSEEEEEEEEEDEDWHSTEQGLWV